MIYFVKPSLTSLAWTQKPIKQDVVYEDAEGLKASLQKLQQLPPLVTTQEAWIVIAPSAITCPNSFIDHKSQEKPPKCSLWQRLCSSRWYVTRETINRHHTNANSR